MKNLQVIFIRLILYPYLYFPAFLLFLTFATCINSQTDIWLHLILSASCDKKNEDSLF